MNKELYKNLHNGEINSIIGNYTRVILCNRKAAEDNIESIKNAIGNFDIIYKSGRTYSTFSSSAQFVMNDRILEIMGFNPIIPWVLLRDITNIPNFYLWEMPPQIAEAIINYREIHYASPGISIEDADLLEKMEIGKSAEWHFVKYKFVLNETKTTVVISTNQQANCLLGGSKWIVKFIRNDQVVAIATTFMFHTIREKGL